MGWEGKELCSSAWRKWVTAGEKGTGEQGYMPGRRGPENKGECWGEGHQGIRVNAREKGTPCFSEPAARDHPFSGFSWRRCPSPTAPPALAPSSWGAAAGDTERTPPGWRGLRGWDSPSCCCGNRCEGQRGASSGAVRRAAALTSRGGGAGGRAGRLRRDRELLREGAPGEVRDSPRGSRAGWAPWVAAGCEPASASCRFGGPRVAVVLYNALNLAALGS